MKAIKMFAIACLTAGMAMGAHAIPSFNQLATQANNAGGNINISSFDHNPITNDALWEKFAGSAVKFKSEISGYKNRMGYANSDGTGVTMVLNEGAKGWKSLAAAPNPFVFALDTGVGHVWYSDNSLNKDGLDHMVAFQKKNGSNRFILFWDDQNGGGDRDFNDFVARVNFVAPVVAVSEPGSLALLGAGLLGLAASRRRQK